MRSLDEWIARGHEPARPMHSPAAHAFTRDARWPGVLRALGLLTHVERRVLVLHFAHGLTLKEIGARVHLSESGACRVRARALGKLRRACDAHDVEDAAARGA